MRSDASLIISSQPDVRGALAWRERLSAPHALAWLQASERGANALAASRGRAGRLMEFARDQAGMRTALGALFAAQGFPDFPAGTDADAQTPEGVPDDLRWRRDALGRPFVTWAGPVRAWAEARGLSDKFLHVSNSHDGDAHLVFAAYGEQLVGVGMDIVSLPRLRMPGKDRAYLLRFAAQFMGQAERETFAHDAADDEEEALRVRVAAHFSLMEAASKACGTGLKIGAGMGRAMSLPKQSLGVQTLAPHVALQFGSEALARLQTLGAARHEAHWAADTEYLTSVVLLRRDA